MAVPRRYYGACQAQIGQQTPPPFAYGQKWASRSLWGGRTLSLLLSSVGRVTFGCRFSGTNRGMRAFRRCWFGSHHSPEAERRPTERGLQRQKPRGSARPENETVNHFAGMPLPGQSRSVERSDLQFPAGRQTDVPWQFVLGWRYLAQRNVSIWVSKGDSLTAPSSSTSSSETRLWHKRMIALVPDVLLST